LSSSVGSPLCWCCCRPSETKQSGGDGPPLQLEALSHPDLNPVRRKLTDELVTLAGMCPRGWPRWACLNTSTASWNVTVNGNRKLTS
jgi:hypothetical protein